VVVGDLASAIGRHGFRRVTWREGTRGNLASRFAAERVVLAEDDEVDPAFLIDATLGQVSGTCLAPIQGLPPTFGRPSPDARGDEPTRIVVCASAPTLQKELLAPARNAIKRRGFIGGAWWFVVGAPASSKGD
jgi:hypothetical protein